MFKSLLAALALSLAFAANAFAGAVNINTADAASLAAALKGVGQSKAEAIVAYRKEHGAFKSADELAQVKGIGQKLVDKNRDLILVGDAAPKAKAESKPAAKAEAQPAS